MFQRRFRLPTFVAAAVAALGMTVPTTAISHADYQPIMALLGGNGPVVPLKNAAMMERTEGGLRYVAGQQNSHLTITEHAGGLLFVDTGTLELRSLPGVCQRVPVAVGVAALCGIPAAFSEGEMYIEVWPRLGRDYVNGSTLPSRYRMWVLADAGRDKVLTGAGDDFVNGAQQKDRVWGGAGDDWIRTGIGNDVLYGQDGNDNLVGHDDDDEVHGGPGDDRVGGGSGSDTLWPEEGNDVVLCGSGPDVAFVDGSDKAHDCES